MPNKCLQQKDLLMLSQTRGHFEGGTRWNAVEKLPECMGTTLPLFVKVTHYGRHWETFSGQKCTGLHDFAFTSSKFFMGWYPTEERPRWLDPDTISAWLVNVLILRNDHCHRPPIEWLTYLTVSVMQTRSVCQTSKAKWPCSTAY